jgi:hypothetical protein
VTTGHEDPGHGHFLASDADREQVIDTLKVAFTEGRLTQDELDLRAGQTFTSRTYADLAAVTADIPARPAASQARPLAKPARASAQTPDSQAFRRGLGGGAAILSAMIAASALTGSDEIGNLAILLMSFYVLFVLIAVGNLVNSRLENRRARKELPPPPGPGGRTLGRVSGCR